MRGLYSRAEKDAATPKRATTAATTTMISSRSARSHLAPHDLISLRTKMHLFRCSENAGGFADSQYPHRMPNTYHKYANPSRMLGGTTATTERHAYDSRQMIPDRSPIRLHESSGTMTSDTSSEAAGNETGEALKPVAAGSNHSSAHKHVGTAATTAKPRANSSPEESPTRRRLQNAESSPKESLTRRRHRNAGSNPKAENANPAKPVPTLKLDEETDAALTLFNTYLKADRARRQHERDVKKAEKAKADAAAKVRRLNNRETSSAEAAEAEAAYRETVNALNLLKQNKQNKPVGAD